MHACIYSMLSRHQQLQTTFKFKIYTHMYMYVCVCMCIVTYIFVRLSHFTHLSIKSGFIFYTKTHKFHIIIIRQNNSNNTTTYKQICEH